MISSTEVTTISEEHLIETLQFNQLAQGGFAGLKERQFVMDKRVFGQRKQPKVFNELENFVYLAVVNLSASQQVNQQGEIMAYLSKGKGLLNGETIGPRTLVRVQSGIEFTAEQDAQLIVIYATND